MQERTFFSLTLPAIFGCQRVGSKGDSDHPLPSVLKKEHWNPSDGQTGLETKVNNKLVGVMEGVAAYINRKYTNHKVAKLAHAMANQAYTRWTLYASWKNSDYARFVTTSGCTSLEAWMLTCECALGFFEEHRKVRLLAEEAEDEDNPIVRCAMYLWASLQSRRVLQEFVRSYFRGHHVMAPIINLHLFQHWVPLTTYDALDVKFKKLEGLVSRMKATLDKVQSKQNAW